MPQSSRLDRIRADRARRDAVRASEVSRYDPNEDPFAGITFDANEPPRQAPTPAPPQPQTVNDPQSSAWGKYGGMATRALGAIIGNSGGPWGAAASGISEAAAEKIEGRPLNPWQIGFQTALGAVPLGRLIGKGVGIAGSAIKGALFSTAGTAGTRLAEGELPTMQELETSALVGGVTGGAVRGLQKAMGGKVPAKVLTAEDRVPTVPRVAAPMENEAFRMARAEQPAMNFDIPTPERGSELAQQAILGSHATAARYSRMSAELAAQSGKTQALIDRLSGKVRRLEEGAPPSLEGATQRPMFSPEEMTGLSPAARESVTPPTPQPQSVTPPRVPGAPVVSERLARVTEDIDPPMRPRVMEDLDPPMPARTPRTMEDIDPPYRATEDIDPPMPTPARKMPRALMNLVEEARAGREGRTPYTRAIEDIDPPMSVPTPGAPKPHVPAPVTALWQRLKPKWDQALAAQDNDGIPFKVDPTEPLVEFSERIRTAPVRDLMGSERKVRALLDQQAGEGGFISPELAARLGLTLAGGATGAAVDNEDPLRGALLGAGGGFALGSAPALGRALKTPGLTTNLARNADALRYFSMLSGPATQAKNIVGNMGAVGVRSLEDALGGKKNAFGPVKELFSSKTLQDLVKEFKTPQPGRWGQVQGPLGLPGRAMGAVDAATKDALKRAGMSLEDAREVTFTNTPKSESGKAFVNFIKRAPAARMVVPFSQTATNIVERGIERTPIIGLIAQLASEGRLETNFGRQVLGAAAVAAGANFGKLPPMLQAVLAPYSLPYQMGVAGGETASKDKSFEDVAMGAWNDGALDLVPAPMNKRAFDPRQWAAQMVPNALRPVDTLRGVDPMSFDTKSVPFLGPAIAKFPFLNEALLRKKRPTARTVKGRTARSSR